MDRHMHCCFVTKFSNKLVNKDKKVGLFDLYQPLIQTLVWPRCEGKRDGGWEFFSADSREGSIVS